MVMILRDSLQKYGPIGMSAYAGYNSGVATPAASSLSTALAQGGWSINESTGNVSVGPGISAVDISALRFTTQNGNYFYITRSLGSNLPRAIGFFWFRAGDLRGQPGVTLYDGASAQCSIVINQITGIISLRTGATNGATISVSGSALTAGQAVCVAFDITIDTAGAYQVWVNNASVFSGTGNTKGGTANAYVNFIGLGYPLTIATVGGAIGTVDFSNLFINDNTGSTNNAVLLTSPVLQTDFALADSSVQFSQVAFTLGQYWVSNTAFAGTNVVTAWAAPSANTLFLRPFTPAVDGALNGVSCIPEASSVGANYKAVLYADSAGAPGALIATGAQTTGAAAGAVLSSLFGSGQALTGGTQYWLGFITDTSVALWLADTSTTGRSVSNTYGSGAPDPAGSMATGQPDWLIWGFGTAAAANYVAVDGNPSVGLAYNQSSTPGQTDLYTFSGTIAGQVYGVGVSILASNPGGGARTGSSVISSSGTVSAGNNPGWSPGATPIWQDTWVPLDPHTGAAWAPSAVNAALGGPTVVS